MKVTSTTLLLALLPSVSWGFVPRPHLPVQYNLRETTATTPTALNMIWLADGEAAVDAVTSAATDVVQAVSSGAEDVLSSAVEAPSDGGGILDTVKNIALGITAVVFFLAGLTYVTAAVIIPAAAKELESECKELAPELWQEYQQRLEPGQTMDQRPELMQELGAKLQPLLDAKMEREFNDRKAKGEDVSKDEQAWKALDDIKVPTMTAPAPLTAPTKQEPESVADAVVSITSDWDDDGVVDAEVVSEKKTEDKKKEG